MGDRLRVRLFVAGNLVLEDWISLVEAGDMAVAHGDLARKAMESGHRYLVELFDPDVPEEEAYLRFGDDTTGIIDPIPVRMADLGDLIGKLRLR